MVFAPLVLLFIFITLLSLPDQLQAQREFAQTIPADDKDRIIAIAEEELLDSYTFRNHATDPVPYECKVDTLGWWKKEADWAIYDHIVVCTIPVDCEGYKLEYEKVFYITGIRIPADWGRTGDLRDPESTTGQIDRSRLNNCDHY